MTPKSFPDQNADAPDSGEGAATETAASPMDELTASVAEFESSQKAALAVVLGHTSRLQDEFARLAARPTPEQLAEAERTAADQAETIATLTGERDTANEDLAVRGRELADAQTRITGLKTDLATAGESAAVAAKDLEAANSRSVEVSRELAAAQGVIADRDRELAALREASAKDAAALQSFRDRFRSFEAATQSIMAGIALSDGAPAAAAVPASTPAPAEEAPAPADIKAPAEAAAVPAMEAAAEEEEAEVPAIEAPAQEAAEPAARAAANVVPDPFDLGLDDAPAPVGIVLPDLDDLDEDPFDSADSRARAALLATTVGLDDPFDVPEPAAGDDSTGFSFVPAPVADSIEADETPEETAAAPEPATQDAQAQEPGELTAGAQEGAQPSGAQVDPLAFMDFDLGLDDLGAENASAGGVSPVAAPAQKVVPVYI